MGCNIHQETKETKTQQEIKCTQKQQGTVQLICFLLSPSCLLHCQGGRPLHASKLKRGKQSKSFSKSKVRKQSCHISGSFSHSIKQKYNS